MDMSQDGLSRLIQREGFRRKAYRDIKGIWTIGVGHTAMAGPPKPKAGMIISDDTVRSILAHDLVQYEDAVERAIKRPMKQHEFDAMVSLCFNIGTGGFARSSVVRRFNEGNRKAAADAFLKWNKPAVLIARRKSERAQFLGL